MDRQRRKRISILLLVSLLIHVAFMFWVADQKRRASLTPPQEKQLVIQLQPDKSPLDAEKERQMQVVQQKPTGSKEEDNKDADYWSIENRKVEQQQRARNVDDFKNTPFTGPTLSPSQEQEQKQAQSAQPKSKSKVKELGRKVISKSEQIVKNLMTSMNQELMKRQPAALMQPSGNGGPASATDDYLKDVQVGSATVLNTREFKFYSYFERVREQLKQFWRPIVQQKFADIQFMQGRIPTEGEKVTRVAVKMNRDGKIVDIAVIKSSGVGIIDSAAVEAFQRAGAFPNPPSGMIETDGSVNIQWEFVLVVNS